MSSNTTPTTADEEIVEDHRGTRLPPGPPLPRSIQGVGFGLARRPVMQQLRRRYGTAYTVHLPIYGRAVVISDPELAKELFTAPQDAQTNLDPNLGRVLGSESMFALSGTEHRRRRKLLTPPLHGKRIKGYEAIVEEETRRELESWSEGQPFASMPSMTRITLNIIIRTVFGARDEELDTLRRVIPPMSRPARRSWSPRSCRCGWARLTRAPGSTATSRCTTTRSTRSSPGGAATAGWTSATTSWR